MPKLNEILGEESFKQLPEEIKKKYKDIDLVDSSNYIEKKELETANSSIKEYKKQLKDRDKQLNDLKDKAKDSEELSQEIEKLKADNEKTTKDYEAKLSKVNFDTKFEKAIAGYKAKNPKALRALLDMEKVKFVDDTFIGLDEQVKALKESDAYLFEEEQTGGTGSIGGGSSSVIDNDDEKLSLGARLAKERTEAIKVTEAQNKFFS
ncbi:phage scaffold protein [Clostridium botulinum C]|uniref:Phage scaffold protein n=2 Tax=Clostridium botulinum TaxID=1491 RepID=A0A9Q4TL75_CLOBO|nr:phage scaffolding protein [Clostridium botulinum]EGO86253.1 phage scaffold protein [Clostridium botulinum C str. Stockholm]MCD3195708.1 phage scaffold protein [Clostridium botulinum C]MCD3201124.1 phage scaffold protein [Clostridium botulinum C]MCD3206624.1 phage scaffold protein [Clostridium botulinum C]MCD3209377.1 phage scaffold protein [Clostridium botulinum C]